jgi:hypothetical protein
MSMGPNRRDLIVLAGSDCRSSKEILLHTSRPSHSEIPPFALAIQPTATSIANHVDESNLIDWSRTNKEYSPIR